MKKIILTLILLANTCQAKTVRLDWAGMKAIVSNKSMLLQYKEDAKGYDIFALDGPSLDYDTRIVKDGGEDVLDFEANHKSWANQQISHSDPEGIQKVASVPFQDSFKSFMTGGQFRAVPAETVLIEIPLQDAIFIDSVKIIWSGSNFGDLVNASLGFLDGEANFVETEKIIIKTPVFGSGDSTVATKSIMKVPSGGVLRVTYFSVAETTAVLTIQVILRK